MDSDSRRPVVVVEANIPFIRGLLEPYAQVRYLQPDAVDSRAMADADALVTRTRIRCDRRLLEGSRCRLIASATIGLDHVDMAYCRSAGIAVENAPGCNAPAVAQYVLSSILTVYGPQQVAGMTLGIVGVGHVGSIVRDWARQLGLRLLLCDPPRQRAGETGPFVALDGIAAGADIITFHTPYTRSGIDATHHMADESFFRSLRRRPMIINSARGAIVDNEALTSALVGARVSHAVIDCWEGEPDIDRRLLSAAAIATPHIAGYSREGKIRATAMAVDALARHFGWPSIAVGPGSVPPGAAPIVSASAILASYDPLRDTDALKSHPEKFEWLRNNYSLRAEVV